ncbi:hypothetical protein CCY99_05455 [Helicobacter sp. 16-1353]|uniref:hypothetical protein n=1 Tax=Helicobacter sp. 16-1353 TaxID=2004996 RepID=UPI000DCC2C2A|nr:hypothetical protein [Helicobacter sp. 16-1353]RAX53828.1 hypothetical protein CCY99_05455 [Helicobacter sp. 16-1353]
MNYFETRIIKAPLKIEFSKIDNNEEIFKNEFDLLSENNDDPIGSWLKNIRARGKIVDESEPIIQLLVELHRKIDALSNSINTMNSEKKEYIALDSTLYLDSIGHNLLVFANDVLESHKKYYARLDIAVFPIRKIPIFFEALKPKIAKIILMHNRDVVDFDNYIASRERSIIRELKQGNKI